MKTKVASSRPPTIYEAIYPESVAWLKDLAGFSAESFDMTQTEMDSLLGEMSRLFGIMNIEAGSDGDRMREVFLSRLAERGHNINSKLLECLLLPNKTSQDHIRYR